MHYRFIAEDDFLEMRDRGELLEWAEVHGNYYGTPRRPVEQALAAGADMIFDIDWQGTRQIVEKALPDDVVSGLHPAALDGGAEDAARAPRRGPARDDRQAARRARAPRSSTGRSTTTSSSTTTSTAPSTT